MKFFLTLLVLLNLSVPAKAGVLIYQGATATLSSTPSLVTYTTKMNPQGPQIQVYNGPSAATTIQNVDVSDNNYSNGIYYCPGAGTYVVGASLAITGTVSVLSFFRMAIEVSSDSGNTWTALRSKPLPLPVGVGSLTQAVASDYVAFSIPCLAGGQIRVTASTNVVNPTITTTASDNALSITKQF